MKILNKLTLRSLQLNKKRTLVTIIGIVLSCALICGVTTLVTSFQEIFIERARITDGNYHVRFSNVTEENEKYLRHNINVEKYMTTQDVGYSILPGSKNPNKPYLFIKEYDQEAINHLPLRIVEGRLPQNQNELIISDHILTNGKVKYNVGDKIVLDISKRIKDGYELNQTNPNYSYETEELEPETLEKIETREFTIVGIIKRLGQSVEPYDAPGYTVVTCMKDIKPKKDIYILYKNPLKTYQISGAIMDEFGKDKESNVEIRYNNELLKFQGATENKGVQTTLITLSGIVIVIIMLTSIFVIRNSFSISITERFHQYGILASVGATSKQIKRNVLFEGIILGCISIPIGIFSGIFAIDILLKVVQSLLGSMYGVKFILAVSPIGIVTAILFSTITIILSCIIPAKKAAKISPIEAIRSNNDIAIKGKKLKISKLFTKLFGLEGEIALKNLKRSKKKYRTTILSIFFSIIIFISLSSFIQYSFKLSNNLYSKMDYNFKVAVRGDTTLQEEKDIYNTILKLDGIDEYSIVKTGRVVLNIDTYLTSKAKEVYIRNNYTLQEEKQGVTDATVELKSIGKEEYKRYVEKLGGKIEDYKGKGILINNLVTKENQKRVEYSYLNIKEGDHVTGILGVFNRGKEDNLEEPFDMEIAKITDILPMGITVNDYSTAVIIVADEDMDKLDYYYSGLYINTQEALKLEEDIKKIEYIQTPYITNIAEEAKENNASVLVISIFLYGFIGVISLIGITNIFNTITTNMALRNKEFAILKSVGMTDKEFKKMIHFESIFYGLKALIFGIPTGIMLSYFIYTSVTNSFETTYVLPWEAILICIIFVFLIVFSTMSYSRNKTKNQNIIDTIRNDNI